MLDERKRQVLFAIVRDYIQTAEPVGSRTIARRYSFGIGAATIRNEMADLEELGYLEQPHTSAGRIPSDRGYRCYVDSLAELPELTAAEASLVKRHFSGRLRGQEIVLEAAARLLSSITNYTSIVIGPSPVQTKLKVMQVVPLNDHSAVLMIVADNGFVANEVIMLPPGISAEDLSEICRFITAKYRGYAIDRLHDFDFRTGAGDFALGASAFEQAMDSLIASLERHEGERVVLGGATNILNQREFKDVSKLREILKVLEMQEQVFKLVTTAAANPLSISIGAENALEAMRDCSLITASYTIAGEGVGHISILGPTRMEYPRVIALLNYVSKVIGQG
ncbi:MAG: heat-inducible transcription repressor HrcA [Firmicutes bacterium]|nr:heat-inducible transcription repressor HrcA [Dethiobacter sp.]MBS3889450.1 heat-inducible transcription repressor HrcA [Bacillota bacterium]MBS4054858.1 heat-inducible transcription repressor HrcA [Thermaerobacter sp.]